MIDLSQTSIISFEIGDDCNLGCMHAKCPINYRKIENTKHKLTKETVVQSINEAKKMNFHGYFAFHYYNEPLMHKDLILEIMDEVEDCKFMLWTNGVLLDRNVEKNEFLKKFDVVCMTCYFEKDRVFYEDVKKWHGKVEIYDWELDDRELSYTRNYHNEVACRRPFFEMPIDCYGNIHLCCFDWNGTFEIGNVVERSLKEIVLSEKYQKLLLDSKKKLLDLNDCPEVCKRCDKPWLRYTKYYDIG